MINLQTIMVKRNLKPSITKFFYLTAECFEFVITSKLERIKVRMGCLSSLTLYSILSRHDIV